MEYFKAATTAELPAGAKKKIISGDKEILLTNIDGAFYAIDNTCPHMGGSLYDGTLEGSTIICPKHGSAFDVRTGKAIHGGKMLFIKFQVEDVVAYPVKVEGTDILIGIE